MLMPILLTLSDCCVYFTDSHGLVEGTEARPQTCVLTTYVVSLFMRPQHGQPPSSPEPGPETCQPLPHLSPSLRAELQRE